MRLFVYFFLGGHRRFGETSHSTTHGVIPLCFVALKSLHHTDVYNSVCVVTSLNDCQALSIFVRHILKIVCVTFQQQDVPWI
jgi:hypothetical protein